MAVATKPLSSNHLTLETAGLNPNFGTTPGFFSAEFVALNPFDADFHEATVSPLHAETSFDTPPTHYSSFSADVPRSVLDVTMQGNYDTSLPPTPGPRVPMSGLKVSIPSQVSTSRLLPSPEESPTAVLNPAFLERSNIDYSASYHLPPLTHMEYEFTPPEDEPRPPGSKNSISKSRSLQKQTTVAKKRKSEVLEPKSDRNFHDDETHHPSSQGLMTNSSNNNNTANPPDNKRKKFLERNRLAASKCRQKKKEWANKLEGQARYQAQENKLLRASVAQLRDECLYLKNLLLSTHSGCSCVGVKNYLLKEAQLSQQVIRLGGLSPISNLVHPAMDIDGRVGYPTMMGIHHPVDDRQIIVGGLAMSDGRP